MRKARLHAGEHVLSQQQVHRMKDLLPDAQVDWSEVAWCALSDEQREQAQREAAEH